jgi:hypothetical protein
MSLDVAVGTTCLWYHYLVMATLEELWRTFQRESGVYLDAQKALNEAVAGLYSDAHLDLDLVNYDPHPQRGSESSARLVPTQTPFGYPNIEQVENPPAIKTRPPEARSPSRQVESRQTCGLQQIVEGPRVVIRHGTTK